MDPTAPNGHVANPTQHHQTTNQTHKTAKPTQPTLSKPAIAAHFAKFAQERKCSSGILCANVSDRARDVYVKGQLLDRFGSEFGMSVADAKQVVEEEMGRRYAPNPWDAPGPRRPRRIQKVEEEEEEEEESTGGLRYSEEQWDLFEGFLGYR